VYDDKSVLENLHYALLTRIMRDHGLGDLLDRPQSGHHRRQLLLLTLLATDMSVHFSFMEELGNIVDMIKSKRINECPLFTRKVLACQALIKCADISNPVRIHFFLIVCHTASFYAFFLQSRPHIISKEWAVSLSDEWSTQASMEQDLQLPKTVAPSSDALGQANGQVIFIKMFCKPLLDLTMRAIPGSFLVLRKTPKP
jgi:hypothetical protein